MSATMNIPLPTQTRKPRKDGIYTPLEKAILNKHKREYQMLPTRKLRGDLLRGTILPELFHYWDTVGMGAKSEEETTTRMKTLADWIRNNWRPLVPASEAKTSIRVTAIEVVWQEKRDAVLDVMKEILGVAELDSGSPGYFQQRVPAAKLVLDRMTERERAQIDAIVEKRKTEGNVPEVQRQRAEKHRVKYLQSWAKERWMDMGMATLIFTVHTDAQGRLAADVYDDIALNMGYPNKRTFEESHEDMVKGMTRTLLHYVKSLQEDGGVQTAQGTGTGTGNSSSAAALELGTDPDGFPLLPAAASQQNLTKRALEGILRTYLSQHYYLATGRKTRHVPYHALVTDTPAFIPQQYRPDGLTLKDPRNMHKQDVERLLDFIHKRQEAEGPASAFKFSNILVGNEQVPSRYSSCHGTEKVNDAHTKKKRASYKAKARTDTLPPSIPIEHFDQPVPDVVEITNMGQSGGVGDFTEVGDEERNEMVKTGLDKAHLEHMGWLAGGVPRFRVKKNIWMTYKQFTAGGASVQEMPAIDPALYQQDTQVLPNSDHVGRKTLQSHTNTAMAYQQLIQHMKYPAATGQHLQQVDIPAAAFDPAHDIGQPVPPCQMQNDEAAMGAVDNPEQSAAASYENLDMQVTAAIVQHLPIQKPGPALDCNTRETATADYLGRAKPHNNIIQMAPAPDKEKNIQPTEREVHHIQTSSPAPAPVDKEVQNIQRLRGPIANQESNNIQMSAPAQVNEQVQQLQKSGNNEVVVSPQQIKRKDRKVRNSDALAAEEAKLLGCTSKRERRPRVRDS